MVDERLVDERLDAGVFQLRFNRGQLLQAELRLGRHRKRLPRVLAGAVNDTARWAVTQIGRAIRDKVAMKQSDIKPHIKRTRATAAQPSARITLSRSERLSLKRFGARQTKRGVSYRIERAGGRKRIDGAFIVDSLGGHVYRRTGPERLPITKLHGPSPWGLFRAAGLITPTQTAISRQLGLSLRQRVRLEVLRANGKVGRGRGGN